MSHLLSDFNAPQQDGPVGDMQGAAALTASGAVEGAQSTALHDSVRQAAKVGALMTTLFYAVERKTETIRQLLQESPELGAAAIAAAYPEEVLQRARQILPRARWGTHLLRQRLLNEFIVRNGNGPHASGYLSAWNKF